MSGHDGDVTQLVLDWSNGDQEAFDRLVPLVYQDLRIIARRHLRSQRGDQTLNTTALVHELYLNLVDQTRVSWSGRSHFFAAASKAMRHILIDYVRRKGASKRGGDRVRVPLADSVASQDPNVPELLALEEALADLEQRQPRLVRVVECRFFGGMTASETAEALGVGVRTVERDWTRARTYLREALGDGSRDDDAAGPRRS